MFSVGKHVPPELSTRSECKFKERQWGGMQGQEQSPRGRATAATDGPQPWLCPSWLRGEAVQACGFSRKALLSEGMQLTSALRSTCAHPRRHSLGAGVGSQEAWLAAF